MFPESLAFMELFEILLLLIFHSLAHLNVVGIWPYQTLLEINWPIVGSEGSFYHLETGIIIGYNKI